MKASNIEKRASFCQDTNAPCLTRPLPPRRRGRPEPPKADRWCFGWGAFPMTTIEVFGVSGDFFRPLFLRPRAGARRLAFANGAWWGTDFSIQFFRRGFSSQAPKVAFAVGVIGTSVAAATLIQVQIGAKASRMKMTLRVSGCRGEFFGKFHTNTCNAQDQPWLGIHYLWGTFSS